MTPFSSTAVAPTTLQSATKAAAARAADGDFKAPGPGHTVKDADGDYKPTPKASAGTPASTAGATLAALSSLTKGG